jgi:hypothetical protein
LVILNNGSHFNASGAFYQMEAGSAGSNPVLVFDIQDTASSVTAKYASSKGAAFADFAAVQAGLGTFFTSTTLGNGNLVATDNGTTFTVTAKAAGKP